MTSYKCGSGNYSENKPKHQIYKHVILPVRRHRNPLLCCRIPCSNLGEHTPRAHVGPLKLRSSRGRGNICIWDLSHLPTPASGRLRHGTGRRLPEAVTAAVLQQAVAVVWRGVLPRRELIADAFKNEPSADSHWISYGFLTQIPT